MNDGDYYASDSLVTEVRRTAAAEDGPEGEGRYAVKDDKIDPRNCLAAVQIT